MQEPDNIKSKVISATLWTMGEKILQQGANLAITIVLARLIAPEAFGAIAIVMIFTSIASIITTTGFGSALIQKKKPTDIDYSTIFYSNIVIAVALYLLLYFTAPLIAGYYKILELTYYIRIISLTFVISSASNGSSVYIQKKLKFRVFFTSSLVSSVASGVISMYMAYRGYGIWALVIQSLIGSIISSVIILIRSEWRPRLLFSFKSLKELFSFSWKMLLINLLWTVGNNIQGLVIAKKYNESELAYYSKGKHIPDLISANTVYSVNKVMFPALSQYQDDLGKMLSIMRKSISINSFLISPCMIGLAVVSERLIVFLFTDTWISSVPYMQILCIAYLFQPIQSISIQAVVAVGKMNTYLTVEIIKRIIGISLLVAAVMLSDNVIYIVVAMLISEMISTVIIFPVNKKYFNYSYIQQLTDMFRPMLSAILMGVAVYSIGLIKMNVTLGLLLQILAGVLSFLLFSFLFDRATLKYILSSIRKRKS